MKENREVILLVDDEYIVLQSAKRLLEKKGFNVLTASNGLNAMDVLKEHKDKIGVILLDLSMPGMDGEETLVNLMEIDPSAKVILFSGYAVTREIEPLFGKGAIGHIQKPFDIKELLAKLYEALNQTEDKKSEPAPA